MIVGSTDTTRTVCRYRTTSCRRDALVNGASSYSKCSGRTLGSALKGTSSRIAPPTSSGWQGTANLLLCASSVCTGSANYRNSNEYIVDVCTLRWLRVHAKRGHFRYLEVCRRVIVEDLKVVKSGLVACFPPEYKIYDRYINMYHEAISSKVLGITLHTRCMSFRSVKSRPRIWRRTSWCSFSAGSRRTAESTCWAHRDLE